MGVDFYSYNRVVLAGQVFRVGEVDTKKSQTIRLQTREVFLYGAKKNKAPRSYYHLIKTTGSLAEFCAKYIVPGDIILVEGKIKSFPAKKNQKIWSAIIWAEKVITLSRLESLKDDLKEKFKSAIDKK